MAPKWTQKPIKNILLDINGVLYESGEEHAIEGSVDAMKRLVEHGFEFCLVTNECTTPKRLLTEKLNAFGFDMITSDRIVSPAPTACEYIIQRGLRPRLHVWNDILEDFQPALDRLRESGAGEQPANCLVIGDVMSQLSRDFVDESLEIMLKCPEKPQIISLGAGRYYKDAGRLRLDTGAFAKAFAYALDIDEITCLGKPSAEFFGQALNVLSAKTTSNQKPPTYENTIMIGDDVVSDVGGAQAMGMRGFLVRTGKYKPSDETDRGVIPDDVFDNLYEATDKIISQVSHVV
uniref:Phospholysine phosphohistidine inorganic pyrophosphate phosphatase n=1 Tax=Aceria tosichella TaxID=561515 RepID=A0A6G1SHS9_9ACAR